MVLGRVTPARRIKIVDKKVCRRPFSSESNPQPLRWQVAYPVEDFRVIAVMEMMIDIESQFEEP